MKHRVAGRKLGRTSAHRLAVLRNLSTDLFRHERIQTTLMKAKELRPFAEKLITAGRRRDVHARRRVARHIHDSGILKKLVETISTRFAERPGGYTRILKLGPRRGDSAEMAIIELVGSELKIAPKEEEKKERTSLGRIRERFSRRKKAPEASAEEASAEQAGTASEPKAGKSGKSARGSGAGKKGGAKKSSGPGTAKGAKAAGAAKPPARAKKGGASRKQGGQTPKKGG